MQAGPFVVRIDELRAPTDAELQEIGEPAAAAAAGSRGKLRARSTGSRFETSPDPPPSPRRAERSQTLRRRGGGQTFEAVGVDAVDAVDVDFRAIKSYALSAIDNAKRGYAAAATSDSKTMLKRVLHVIEVARKSTDAVRSLETRLGGVQFRKERVISSGESGVLEALKHLRKSPKDKEKVAAVESELNELVAEVDELWRTMRATAAAKAVGVDVGKIKMYANAAISTAKRGRPKATKSATRKMMEHVAARAPSIATGGLEQRVSEALNSLRGKDADKVAEFVDAVNEVVAVVTKRATAAATPLVDVSFH